MGIPSLRFAHALLAAAWLLFMVSLWLPATNVAAVAGGGNYATGWQAFTSCLTIVLYPWIWLFEPRMLLVVILPFANIVVIVAPFLCPTLRGKSGLLAVMLVPCAIVPWFLPRSLTGQVGVGYYVWIISFLMMSAACGVASMAYEAADNPWYTEWKERERRRRAR